MDIILFLETIVHSYGYIRWKPLHGNALYSQISTFCKLRGFWIPKVDDVRVQQH
jgi:hypothetical protein